MHMNQIPTDDGTRRFDEADSRVTRFGQYFITAKRDRMVFVPWAGGRPEEVVFDLLGGLARNNVGQALYDGMLAHHKTLLIQDRKAS
jgi:hypothetical protein